MVLVRTVNTGFGCVLRRHRNMSSNLLTTNAWLLYWIFPESPETIAQLCSVNKCANQVVWSASLGQQPRQLELSQLPSVGVCISIQSAMSLEARPEPIEAATDFQLRKHCLRSRPKHMVSYSDHVVIGWWDWFTVSAFQEIIKLLPALVVFRLGVSKWDTSRGSHAYYMMCCVKSCICDVLREICMQQGWSYIRSFTLKDSPWLVFSLNCILVILAPAGEHRYLSQA
jgi:hypothetical protein